MTEKKRDYKKELAYESTPEQKHNRAMRNAARRQMIREGKAHVGDGMDVGHKKALIEGGSNSRSNYEMQSVKYNRGWEGRGKRP